MTTKRLCPGADGEGALGKTGQRWGDVQSAALNGCILSAEGLADTEAAGVVELATLVETLAGTSTSHVVTPAGLKGVADTLALQGHTHTVSEVTDMPTLGSGMNLPTQSIVACQMTAGRPDFLTPTTTGIELAAASFRVAAGDGPGGVREGEFDGTGTAPAVALANSGTALGFAALAHTAARSEVGVVWVADDSEGTADTSTNPWNMFNGNGSTTWYTFFSMGTDEEAHFVYEFGLPQAIEGLRMVGRASYPTLRPREFRVLADGVSVGTFTEDYLADSTDFAFGSTITAKRWDFYCKSNNGTAGNTSYTDYVAIGEIEFNFASNEFTTAKYYLCADVASDGTISLAVSTTAPTFGPEPEADEEHFDIALNTMSDSAGTQLWRVPIAIVEASLGILCAQQFWPGTYALLDVNGGEDVEASTAYVEPSPFYGPCDVCTEAYYNSKWGDTGFFYSSSAYGIRCSHSDDETETIRVGVYTMGRNTEALNELNDAAGITTPVPARRHVRRLY